jgi:hypothetical protein
MSELFHQLSEWLVLVQQEAQARSRRHVPSHTCLGVGALVRALVVRIAKCTLSSVQQGVGLDRVMHVACVAVHRVHQPRLGVYADVHRLHAVVPLADLLRLMHLRVVLAGSVIGQAGRSDQSGVHHRAGLEQQTFSVYQLVDDLQNLRRELVALQQVAKAQDGALVGLALAQAA